MNYHKISILSLIIIGCNKLYTYCYCFFPAGYLFLSLMTTAGRRVLSRILCILPTAVIVKCYVFSIDLNTKCSNSIYIRKNVSKVFSIPQQLRMNKFMHCKTCLFFVLLFTSFETFMRKKTVVILHLISFCSNEQAINSQPSSGVNLPLISYY